MYCQTECSVVMMAIIVLVSAEREETHDCVSVSPCPWSGSHLGLACWSAWSGVITAAGHHCSLYTHVLCHWWSPGGCNGCLVTGCDQCYCLHSQHSTDQYSVPVVECLQTQPQSVRVLPPATQPYNLSHRTPPTDTNPGLDIATNNGML